MWNHAEEKHFFPSKSGENKKVNAIDKQLIYFILLTFYKNNRVKYIIKIAIKNFDFQDKNNYTFLKNFVR